MAIRQRQMYETAFDSKVKRDVEDIDRLTQSPMLQNGEPTLRLRVATTSGIRSRVGSRGGSPVALRLRESRDTTQPQRHHLPLHFTPTEKRKVTLIRDPPRSLSPQPQRGSVERLPPSSLLNMVQDRRRGLPYGDHSASAPASTSSLNRTSSEEDRLSRPKFLSESSHIGSSTFAIDVHATNGGEAKTFSPTTEFKKLDMMDTVTNGHDSDRPAAIHLNSHAVHDNARPTSWRNAQDVARTNVIPPTSLGLPLPSNAHSSALSTDDGDNRPSPRAFGPVPLAARPQGVASPQSIPTAGPLAPPGSSGKRQPPVVKSSGLPARPNLSLNFNSSPKRARQHLILNFGCAALSVVGERVDPAVPLEKQGWFHGFISRIDAENALRLLKEGSYLVRNCETCKHDYLLSLKSAKGFMHMKIGSIGGKYILGQVSQPFDSVPLMVHHYSLNKLPIRGAEHMTLLHPVIDQLL